MERRDERERASSVPSRRAEVSDRDKKQHSDIRGMDGKSIQTEQYQDHAANRLDDTPEADET